MIDNIRSKPIFLGQNFLIFINVLVLGAGIILCLASNVS